MRRLGKLIHRDYSRNKRYLDVVLKSTARKSSFCDIHELFGLSADSAHVSGCLVLDS